MKFKLLSLLIVSVVIGLAALLFKPEISYVLAKAEKLAVKAEAHSGSIMRRVQDKIDQAGESFEKKPPTASIDLDASNDGPIYGDAVGLSRVKKLEAKLHKIKIRPDHPRILITQEKLSEIRKKTRLYSKNWQKILHEAEAESLIHAAFAYAVLSSEEEKSAAVALDIAKKKLFEMEPDLSKGWSAEKDVAIMAIAFDWIYTGLSDGERNILATKIGALAKLRERAEKIKSGYKEILETFHREEWVFNSWRAWPEIALAYHVPEAEFCYKTRWRYDWYWGDAARMYAYAADGTPFEGYYYGADGADWFLALKSSTGINLVDDPEMGWCKNAAYYMLYRLDLGLGREIFHKGVSTANAGILSYSRGISAWKFKELFGRTMAIASDDPYCKWAVENIAHISPWLVTTTGYSGLKEFGDIAYLVFNEPDTISMDPRRATYDNLPYARFFSGGKEAYMRTSWRPESTCVGFTSKPAYTMTSHSDFDVNTFKIYKMGNLSPDSGVYDAYYGQKVYFNYQKNTVAHNNILVVDPARPNEPRKLGRSPDPGGTELASSRTFGAMNRFGMDNVFLHNPKVNWSQVLDFKTTYEYDFIICDATKAYSSRLDEYIRTLVFIRKGDSAYVVVFDRVEAKHDNFIKKWLLHLVGEPDINGRIVKTNVPGHYEIYDGDFLTSNNVFKTSKLYMKSLLPKERTISKIGGEGFEFYVEGTRPKNFGLSDEAKKSLESNLGGPWQEVGTWRVEVMPTKKQKRDYFLHVMYAAGAQETLNPDDITLVEEPNNFIVKIKDDKLSDVKIKFTKTGKPEVIVDIPESNIR